MDAPDIMASSMSVPQRDRPIQGALAVPRQIGSALPGQLLGRPLRPHARVALLRSHVANDKVFFGVNHSMVDFVNKKRKRLDLVVCRPDSPWRGRTFEKLAAEQKVILTGMQRADLVALPVILRPASARCWWL